jgi:hypothetical protein
VREVWREIGDDEPFWERFEDEFEFHPDFYDGSTSAIRLPAGSMIVDLSPVFEDSPARHEAGCAAVQAAAVRAFVWLAEGEDLVALDWKHPSYLWAPADQAILGGQPAVPVYPDGDYYMHMTRDLRWGTFGHPWQRTLTIWGADLVGTLGVELASWLPVRQAG